MTWLKLDCGSRAVCLEGVFPGIVNIHCRCFVRAPLDGPGRPTDRLTERPTVDSLHLPISVRTQTEIHDLQPQTRLHRDKCCGSPGFCEFGCSICRKYPIVSSLGLVSRGAWLPIPCLYHGFCTQADRRSAWVPSGRSRLSCPTLLRLHRRRP